MLREEIVAIAALVVLVIFTVILGVKLCRERNTPEPEQSDHNFLVQVPPEKISSPSARATLIELQKVYSNIKSINNQILDFKEQKENCFSANEASTLETAIQEKINEQKQLFFKAKELEQSEEIVDILNSPACKKFRAVTGDDSREDTGEASPAPLKTTSPTNKNPQEREKNTPIEKKIDELPKTIPLSTGKKAGIIVSAFLLSAIELAFLQSFATLGGFQAVVLLSPLLSLIAKITRVKEIPCQRVGHLVGSYIVSFVATLISFFLIGMLQGVGIVLAILLLVGAFCYTLWAYKF